MSSDHPDLRLVDGFFPALPYKSQLLINGLVDLWLDTEFGQSVIARANAVTEALAGPVATEAAEQRARDKSAILHMIQSGMMRIQVTPDGPITTESSFTLVLTEKGAVVGGRVRAEQEARS